ncbi:uncharacterized protein CLUP02_11427 [Colletotrichum lupini]|uniref:Uncharacterized protein n=1 Tax=Colletotrichum lupini TaxID=145971 RepID=A0A9Q8WJG9_9PEZI|nr:uncharacterized protein CLUP02_11427 [Colletotrichum lupini]UQC85928.1 hypothetical protein CLUP02_11427 [Colletotrichum lupini]
MNHSPGFCPPELTGRAARLCSLFLRCLSIEHSYWSTHGQGPVGLRQHGTEWHGVTTSFSLFPRYPSKHSSQTHASQNSTHTKSEQAQSHNREASTFTHISHFLFVCLFFSPFFHFLFPNPVLGSKPLYKTSGQQRGYEKGGHDGPKRPRIIRNQ